MGIETKERAFTHADGTEHLYTVTTLSATKGLRVWTTLVRIVSPSIGALADGNKSILDTEITGDTLGKALKELSANITEDTVEKLVKDLLSTVRVDKRELVFDLDFAGQYGLLFKVVGFALEANYSDFFGGLKTFADKAILSASQPKSVPQPALKAL